jgi:hypothetical protein
MRFGESDGGLVVIEVYMFFFVVVVHQGCTSGSGGSISLNLLAIWRISWWVISFKPCIVIFP